MKKFIAAAFLGLGLTLIAASPVLASNAHQEESDGCDHGNTGKDCKPDPSENGKDCDVHGNHGGVNEDHCTADEPTTATTQPPTTTTTEAPTTTTTQPQLEVTTTTQPEPVLVVVNDPAPPVDDNDAQAADQNDAVAQPVLTTDVEAVSLTQPEAPVAPVAPAAALSVPAPAQELPHTGASSLALLAFGLGLAFTGIGIKTAVAVKA